MAETSTTTQQTAQLQVPTSVKSLIEALIFGAREPLSARQIQVLYEDQGTEGTEPRKISYEEIARIVEELNAECTASDKPYRIVQIAGGYQFATQQAYAEWLGKLYKEQTRRKLSQSSVETLAIIAYKQPITKPELEAIRGVNCDYVLSTLLEKDLATIVGRAATVGRPLLYGTSKEFLKHFGLNDLNDLPRPREIQDILGESQFETERRMLEAQQGLDQPKKEEDFKSRLPHIPKRKAGLDDDVKILPRKRTREIKVRQAEDADVSQAGAMQEEQPVTTTPETTSVAEPQDKILEVPESDQIVSTESPAVAESREEVAETSELAGVEPEGTESLSQEQSKYIGLTQGDVGHGADHADEAEHKDAFVEEPAHIEEQPEVELRSPEPAVEQSAVEPEPLTVEPADQTPMPLVDEEQTPARVPDSVVTTSEVIEASQETSVLTPQADSPTVEVQSEVAGYAEPEIAHAEEPDAQTSNQPKTRWTTWKEKIQGFIKKLFG